MLQQITKTRIALVFAFASLLLGGCTTVGKPKEIDPATGRIKTSSIYGEIKPDILTNRKIEIGRYKDLILVVGDKFVAEQTVCFGFFKEVVTREQLEEKLIQTNKTNGLDGISGPISWKRAAENYKPFMVLKSSVVRKDNTPYFNLKAYTADTAEIVFESEVKMDFMWKGIYDDVLFYPLYNSFIDWVRAQR